MSQADIHTLTHRLVCSRAVTLMVYASEANEIAEKRRTLSVQCGGGAGSLLALPTRLRNCAWSEHESESESGRTTVAS